MSGFTDKPNLDDPSEAMAHRAIQALRREFDGDKQVPRFVVVVETPPIGRIALASTGDDETDTHRMLLLGAAAVRVGMSPADLNRARRAWDAERRKLGL